MEFCKTGGRTYLQLVSQNGNLPQVGVEITTIWNHHLVKSSTIHFRNRCMTHDYTYMIHMICVGNCNPCWIRVYVCPNLERSVTRAFLEFREWIVHSSQWTKTLTAIDCRLGLKKRHIYGFLLPDSYCRKSSECRNGHLLLCQQMVILGIFTCSSCVSCNPISSRNTPLKSITEKYL